MNPTRILSATAVREHWETLNNMFFVQNWHKLAKAEAIGLVSKLLAAFEVEDGCPNAGMWSHLDAAVLGRLGWLTKQMQ